MTTSRTEHQYQGTVRPGYSHQHPQHFHHNHQPLHLQERSLHPMHPLSPPTPNMHSQFSNNDDTAMDSIQPLACLSAAAVAVATGAIVQNQPRDDHCHKVMDIDDDTESNRVRLPSIKMTKDSDGAGDQDNKERDGRSPQFTHQRIATSARYFGVSTEGASRAPGSTKTMIMTTQEPHDNEPGSGQGGEDGSTRSAVVWDKAHGESNSRQQLPPVQTRQHHHPPSITNVRASRDSSFSALNGSSSSLSASSSPRDGDMTTAGHAHEGIGDHDHSSHSSRRGSLAMDHITTPTPSPLGHAPDYASAPSEPSDTTSTGGAVHHHLQQLPPKHQDQGGNGHNHHHHFTPEHQQQQQQPYPSSYKTHPSQDHPAYSPGQYSGTQHTHNTPSPPLPSPADGFHAQDPSNPSHQSYRSDSRRGSITDPDYHGSAMAVDRRPSNAGTIDGSPGYYGPNTPASIAERRHYAASSPSSTPSSATSEPHPHHQHHGPYAPHAHPSTSPMQLRQSEQYAGGRRESLPSIHSSAGPLGQLLAQEPQRRHSIAHADPMGPLKRKISTPLSQMHSSSTAEHPAKRRDSIPDAAHPHHHGHHQHHPHHHHPYPPRSSFSAPSSPPRRGSLAPPPPVPTLNLQPAAEIKSSPNHHGGPAPSSSGYGSSNGNSGMSSSSISHINGSMDHVRPHFTQHQPRRPSLLSDASLSRRSSVADVSSQHYPPAHYQSSSSSSSLQQQQDYDNNMNIDLQNMNLSGAQQHNGSEGGHGYGGSTPAAPTGTNGSNGSMSHAHHLYPGYPSYADGGSQKGDTPYSRSPELRVSHKLAERKRRKEMKELFDELRDSLPVDRSLKTSKWEILSKAVDFISSMKNSHDEMAKEVDMLRQELSRLQKR